MSEIATILVCFCFVFLVVFLFCLFFFADSKNFNGPSYKKAAVENDNRKTASGASNNKHSSTPQAA